MTSTAGRCGAAALAAVPAVDGNFSLPVALPFEEALIRMEVALKAESFGVLCQIDMQAKLHEKLGVEFPGTLFSVPATRLWRMRR